MSLLKINGDKFEVKSLEELTKKLNSVKDYKYSDVWLESSDGLAMAVLVNGDFAFSVFWEDEETFYHPIHTTFESEIGEIDFKLANGQRDFYPKKDCVDTKTALEAIKQFFETKEKPEIIKWLKTD